MTQAGSDQAVHGKSQADLVVPAGITDAGLSAWSRQSATSTRSDQKDMQTAADRGQNPGLTSIDLAEKNIYAPGANSAGDVIVASLGTTTPDGADTRVSEQTGKRLVDSFQGLEKGDTRALQLYVRDMNSAMFWDPAKGKDMQTGMKRMIKFLDGMHIDTKLVNGELTLTMPGKDGKSLTIDKYGRTSLEGNDLRDFQKNLQEYIVGKDTNLGNPMSDKTIQRLDSVEDGLRKNDLKGLTDTLKEIGDKIHSIKPGAAGEKERKEAKDLQGMLGALGDEFSSKNVDARYDEQSGNFKITQPNAKGEMETLTVDKFGRPDMSGQKLQDFLTRWQKNLNSPQETIIL